MPMLYLKADSVIKFSMSDSDVEELGWISDPAEDAVNAVDFRIDDPDDPISPALCKFYQDEALSGAMTYQNLGNNTYAFKLSGIFKAKVHKEAIRLINEGSSPYVEGVTRGSTNLSFGDYLIPSISNTDWEFSVKKIKG